MSLPLQSSASTVLAMLITIAAAGVDLAATTTPIWVDTDNSAGVPGGLDIDDALALIQLFHSPEREVVGISTTYGNAKLDDVTTATDELLQKYFPDKGLNAYPGASRASQRESTPAVEACKSFIDETLLHHDKAEILVLGPLTNVADLLFLYPEYAPHLKLIFVGGRRPGQRFNIGSGRALTDLNFELDPESAALVLTSGVELTLLPFEIGTQIVINSNDLSKLEGSSEPSALWVADVARKWLRHWTRSFRVSFFHPWDCLAVLYITHPGLVSCTAVNATIELAPSDTKAWDGKSDEKLYLHVLADNVNSPPPRSTGAHIAAAGTTRVTHLRYCHTVSPEAQQTIVGRLIG